MKLLALLLPAALLAATPSARADDAVLNVYSARHYPSDEALYAGFTRATGIRLNRVESDDAGVLARLKAEGAASPADVILLVDAARLWRAQVDGLFLPVRSKVLEASVPAQFRAKPEADGTTAWFGLSRRARIVVYDKSRVRRDEVDSYAKLADPRHKGRLCTRSGSHPYNLSLFGAMTEHLGPQKAEAWLKGLVDNMARPPRGGDTDQIKGVASGECAIAITNSYYLARMLSSARADERAMAERVGVVFPDQAGAGTHVNVAGGAVARHSRNVAGAVRFLEYLVGEEAQRHFATGNNEWPIVAGVRVDNPALRAMSGGDFKSEVLPVSVVGMNQVKVQQMLDRVGYR